MLVGSGLFFRRPLEFTPDKELHRHQSSCLLCAYLRFGPAFIMLRAYGSAREPPLLPFSEDCRQFETAASLLGAIFCGEQELLSTSKSSCQ